jgi:hypothetical protein
MLHNLHSVTEKKPIQIRSVRTPTDRKNAPFRIIGANYPVYQQENMKYIIVGYKS